MSILVMMEHIGCRPLAGIRAGAVERDANDKVQP